jgi:hypothetical protein
MKELFSRFSQGSFIVGALISGVLCTSIYRETFHIPERRQLQHESAIWQQRNNTLRFKIDCLEKKQYCDFKPNKEQTLEEKLKTSQ